MTIFRNRGSQLLLLIVFLLNVVSCQTAVPIQQTAAPVKVEEKICLVLSVGELKGFAHIGAIKAIKEKNFKIDCVFGNSMGAVIGSLYTSSPRGNLANDYREFADLYAKETEEEKTSKGLSLGTLAGAAVAIFSGGLLAPAAVAVGAFSYGARSIEKLDFPRFQKSLDAYLENIRFAELDIPLATSYNDMVNGKGLVSDGEGNVAEAVCRSAQNQILFKNANHDFIDPALDGEARVPILQAYKMFRPTRIIAINVTGKPAYYHPEDLPNCSVTEIIVNVGEPDRVEVSSGERRMTGEMRRREERKVQAEKDRVLMEILSGRGEHFDAIVNAGYRATFAGI